MQLRILHSANALSYFGAGHVALSCQKLATVNVADDCVTTDSGAWRKCSHILLVTLA